LHKSPLVSVLIPMYNAENYIEPALESIQNQTYPNLEIICINDGSNDATFSIVESKAKLDSRIKLHSHEHRGNACSRNKSIELSRGKYLAIMDADDISRLDRIEKQVNYMESNPDIVASSGNVEEFDEQGVFQTLTRPTNPEVLEFRQLRGIPIWHPTAIFRHSVLLNNNIRYSEKFTNTCEDYKLVFDLSQVGKLGNIPDVLLAYRRYPGQTISRYLEKRKKHVSEIKAEIYKFLCRKYALNPAIDNPGEWRRKIPRNHDAIWTFLWYTVTRNTNLTKLKKLRLVLFTHLRLTAKPRLIYYIFKDSFRGQP